MNYTGIHKLLEANNVIKGIYKEMTVTQLLLFLTVVEHNGNSGSFYARHLNWADCHANNNHKLLNKLGLICESSLSTPRKKNWVLTDKGITLASTLMEIVK